jgi:putative molybdopterin biosynthesis protein
MNLELQWRLCSGEDREASPNLFTLLKTMRESGSLKSAAELTGISYRHAWGLIHTWSNHLGMPLAVLEKGRGASLTELGEKLLWSEQFINTSLSPELRRVASEINSELNALVEVDERPVKVRINASHGMAIDLLQKLCHQSQVINIDFHFRGSLESLRELAGSRCDIAGFHFPAGEISNLLAPHYRQWLDPDRHRLLHVSTREQGLMTSAGNPKGITGLESLTRRSIKFLNRQPDSGTRLILDELLRQKKIDRHSIKGYEDVEFTHIAVAAMVASSAVDAGFGIRAAAGKFGLHFIPMVKETYVLAIRNELTGAVLKELQSILHSRKFRDNINALPGYNATRAGLLVDYIELFPG